MTVHAAKGLEFEHVYLIGMAQEVFPFFRALKKGPTSQEMEEERRSCFVAITRARKTLTMTRSRVSEGGISVLAGDGATVGMEARGAPLNPRYRSRLRFEGALNLDRRESVYGPNSLKDVVIWASSERDPESGLPLEVSIRWNKELLVALGAL